MTARRGRGDTPEEVAEILRELDRALDLVDDQGRRVSNAKFGVYAFYDYDGEPIYVGQTREKLRVRIRRHLTNQRTDAVAMNVLDPFEVADVEMWPFWDLEGRRAGEQPVKALLNSAEYTVFQKLLRESVFQAVLNEVPVAPTPTITLPPSLRVRIVPEPVYARRLHPDLRLARRANTIAKLAEVISQRAVKRGLRNTLLTQARRLEHLANERLEQLGGPPQPGEYSEAETEKEQGDDDG